MEQKLTLLIWPDYVNPLTLEQFHAKIVIETVPSAVEMMARIRAADSTIDLLCPPDYVVRELGAEGHLLKLDHAQLPNLQHLQPRFRAGRAHDPEGHFSIVKDWGTTGLMYRTDKISETPHSWSDFWKLAEKYSGHVTVLDSPGEVIGAALKMRGHAYNETDAQALEQARLDLLTLKPHLRAFETNYRPLLTSGEVFLALGWNGDAAALKASGVPIQYVIPSEGSQLWEDDWAIAKASAQPEIAHDFLNFVLRPEVALQEANYTGYATANQSAFDRLTSAQQHDSSVYPAHDTMQKLEQGQPLPPETQYLRQKIWAEVRA